MASFLEDTALTPLGDGRFEATITRRWWIVIGPNGGLLAALLLRAAEAVVRSRRDDLTPRIQSTQYLNAAVEGPVVLTVVVEREGRRIVQTAVEMTQGSRIICRARVTYGGVQPPAFDAVDLRMPAVAQPADCPEQDGPAVHDAQTRLERRWAISEPGCWGGWLRMTPPVPIDHVVVTSYCDNWPPVLRTHVADEDLRDRTHTTTIELTTYFRTATIDLAAEDYCLIVLRSGTSAEGYHQEDAELWSPDGRLLATSRQLALVFVREG